MTILSIVQAARTLILFYSSPHRPLKQNKTVVASGRPSQAIPLLGRAKRSEQRLFSSTQLASQLTSASANDTNLSPVLLLIPPAAHPDFSFDAVTSFSSYGRSSCIRNVVALTRMRKSPQQITHPTPLSLPSITCNLQPTTYLGYHTYTKQLPLSPLIRLMNTSQR